MKAWLLSDDIRPHKQIYPHDFCICGYACREDQNSHRFRIHNLFPWGVSETPYVCGKVLTHGKDDDVGPMPESWNHPPNHLVHGYYLCPLHRQMFNDFLVELRCENVYAFGKEALNLDKPRIHAGYKRGEIFTQNLQKKLYRDNIHLFCVDHFQVPHHYNVPFKQVLLSVERDRILGADKEYDKYIVAPVRQNHFFFYFDNCFSQTHYSILFLFFYHLHCSQSFTTLIF